MVNLTTTHYLVMAGLAAALILAWIIWPRIQAVFADSETVFLARFQMLLGVLMMADLTPIIPARYMPFYVVASGLITELARRSRSPDV